MNIARKVSIAVLTVTASLNLHAQVISWNWDNYGTINGNSLTSGWTTPNPNQAGVVLAPNWNDAYYMNNHALSGTNMIDSLGAQTTLGYSLTDPNGSWSINFSHPGQDADGSYNRELLNGYINAGGANSASIALQGITYSDYDIYVYFSSDVAGRIGTVTDGAITYDFSTEGPAATGGATALFAQTTDTTGANPTADYAVFSDLTGGSQTITTTIPAYGGIAGIQIVAVPEPGNMALAGLGGAALLVLARRKKLSTR